MFDNKYFLINLIILFVLSIFCWQPVFAKDVCRTVKGNWMKEDSPVNVLCNLLVPQGDTLSVQEGVKIVFKPNTAIRVEGNLTAMGTKESPISFTSVSENWTGIQVRDKGKIQIDHCKILSTSGAAISIESTSVSTIKNSKINGTIRLINGNGHRIENNEINVTTSGRYGLYAGEDSDRNLIYGNTISASGHAIYLSNSATRYFNAPTSYSTSDRNEIVGNTILRGDAGIHADHNYAIIKENTVKGCKRWGVHVYSGLLEGNSIHDNEGWGISVNSQNIQIKGNKIYNNKSGALLNQSYEKINATGNWWGTNKEEEIGPQIFDYFQDSQKGIVEFKPFLTKE